MPAGRVALDPLMHEAARLLGRRSRLPLPFDPVFTPLAPSEAPPVAAVDGSHTVLVDNGVVWVVAVRAVAAAWPDHDHGQAPATVRAVLPDEAADEVAHACTQRGLEPPVSVRSADAYAEALRELEELDQAVHAMRTLPRGGLVLWDGALERLPRGPAARAERLLEAAARHGVDLAGVAKRSRLNRDGVPLLPALHREGTGRMQDQAWSVRVPDYAMAHVAKLHPQAAQAFRVDATRPEVLGRLAPLCRDAVYLGYPYPLAAAHNAAVLTASEADLLRGRLQDAVRAEGGEAADALLRDFHDTLDRNVPG